jgi:uncharacterized membrane protein YdjX (TVP38/TMEM64 family)
VGAAGGGSTCYCKRMEVESYFDAGNFPRSCWVRMDFVSSPTGQRWRKKHLWLAAALAGVVAVGIIIALKLAVRPALESAILALREAGPVVFFGAMALLPAVGFPLMAFTLAAGPVFGPTLGTVGVIGWSLAAVLANLLLTYWLADRALRPLVSRVLAWFEFRLPEAGPGGAWQLVMVVRLAPGLPFWVQSYLLGVIRVPLIPYLAVSMLVMTGFLVALVCGGEAVFQGNGRLALVAVCALGFTLALRQLLRKRAVRPAAIEAGRD